MRIKFDMKKIFKEGFVQQNIFKMIWNNTNSNKKNKD